MTAVTQALPAPGGSPAAAPPPAQFTPRLAVGLGGVLIAAMMSGLNNRVGAIALADVAGVLGMSADASHLLGTVYTAAELAAMPITAWFSVTYSFRRFHMALVSVFLLIGLLLPFAPNYGWLLAMRAVQGFAGGAMIPLLMAGALRFLPPSIKLHGLGFYSLTATFAPNLGLWLAAQWIDGLADWRLVYWQVIPAGVVALWAVYWGIPQDPLRPERMRQIDWLGLATGPLGLALIAIALCEGERLDWLASPAIVGALLSGGALVIAFLISEWFHPLPFVKLQLLERRNFWLAYLLFIGMLVVFVATTALPAGQLMHSRDFRPPQLAPLGLIVGLPQLLLAPLVSALLYVRWIDARHMLALGMLIVAAGCWLGAGVTSEWSIGQFWLAQLCQMIGQPLAVIALLFLITGVAAPMEGPFVAGFVNMLRSLAMIGGVVIVQTGLIDRGAAHLRGMADRTGRLGDQLAGNGGDLFHRFEQQAATLAVADLYRAMALLALALIPLAFMLQHLPAPMARPAKD